MQKYSSNFLDLNQYKALNLSYKENKSEKWFGRKSIYYLYDRYMQAIYL